MLSPESLQKAYHHIGAVINVDPIGDEGLWPFEYSFDECEAMEAAYAEADCAEMAQRRCDAHRRSGSSGDIADARGERDQLSALAKLA